MAQPQCPHGAQGVAGTAMMTLQGTGHGQGIPVCTGHSWHGQSVPAEHMAWLAQPQCPDRAQRWLSQWLIVGDPTAPPRGWQPGARGVHVQLLPMGTAWAGECPAGHQGDIPLWALGRAGSLGGCSHPVAIFHHMVLLPNPAQGRGSQSHSSAKSNWGKNAQKLTMLHWRRLLRRQCSIYPLSALSFVVRVFFPLRDKA